MVIKPTYDQLGSYSEGLIPVVRYDYMPKYGYIDSTGKVVIDFKYLGAGYFKAGLAPVIIEYNENDYSQSKWGYINTNGDVILPGVYYSASEFFESSDGNYYAYIGYPTPSDLATINLKGELVEPTVYDTNQYGLFSDGLKIFPESNIANDISNLNVKKGYIDETGKIVISPQWGFVTAFKNGVAIVGNGEPDSVFPTTYGIIDKKGNYILPLQSKVCLFDSMHEGFSDDGFMIARVEDSYGLIKLNRLITVTLNGNLIKFDQQPALENGRTLVPLRAIFEALGAQMEWNESSQTIIANKDKTTITLQIGNQTATRNGQVINLDVPAKLVGDRTMVPVRFIADAFGVNVQWEEETQMVILTSK